MSFIDQIQSSFPVAQDSIPELDRFAAAVQQNEYLINGELRQWSGPFQEIVSPICVKGDSGYAPWIIGHAPAHNRDTALIALDAAVKAYNLGRGAWPVMSVAARIKHIEDFTVRMKAKRTDVVRFIMWEIAKNREDAEKEFDRTVDYIRDTLQALKELDRQSSRFLIEQGIIGQVRRAPLGVVLCMGPYNYPLNETFATLIPALVMGNTCVFKPPKLGILLYRPLLEAFRDSLPPGVINTVYGVGEEVIPPLMETGRIDVLAFIGSARVADSLKKAHPHPHKLRSVLGLGAKNPAIVLPDADIETTVSECVLGALSYNGQRCTALKIIFVHESIAADFIARMAARISVLKVGMPWDKDAKITPLPVKNKAEYLDGLVQDAITRGAKVVNPDGGTFFKTVFFPALLFPVTPDMRVYQEEQFGPVIPVVPYSNVETALEYVYNSHYGQQLSIFGKDPAIIAQLVDPLMNQVSRVNLNSQCQRGPDVFPFTGRKGSAEGTLSVTDALRAFSIRSLFAAKESELNKGIISDIAHDRTSNFISTDFIF
ncbi:MAG: NADP-dependent glyceraldehyde-3-phosphate dehydrogenase [Spirochaetia bacterium]|nr:NADP-dependent glyceraldehyde-3-phosphate dehydrogenase [Spirochaetia bacterium]